MNGNKLAWGIEELSQAGISNAQQEALWLLRGAEDNFDLYSKMVHERKGGKPLAYILKIQDFMDLQFFVDESVLIPRPETEVLVNAALEVLKNFPTGVKIHDLCTGSGNAAVTLAKKAPHARISASDISADAVDIARMNAHFHSLNDRIDLFVSDLFESVRGKFDIIVANPPYVKAGDIVGLDRELHHEPRVALDGGSEGLSLIERIVQESPDHLNPGGFLLMEIGYDQRDLVLKILEKNEFKNLRSSKDDREIERVVIGQRP